MNHIRVEMEEEHNNEAIPVYETTASDRWPVVPARRICNVLGTTYNNQNINALKNLAQHFRKHSAEFAAQFDSIVRPSASVLQKKTAKNAAFTTATQQSKKSK